MRRESASVVRLILREVLCHVGVDVADDVLEAQEDGRLRVLEGLWAELLGDGRRGILAEPELGDSLQEEGAATLRPARLLEVYKVLEVGVEEDDVQRLALAAPAEHTRKARRRRRHRAVERILTVVARRP